MPVLLEADLTDRIIGAAIEVHRVVRPGCRESTCLRCLCHELKLRGLKYRSEVPLDLDYQGLRVEGAHRIDLSVEERVVEERVVVGLKAVERVLPMHEAQLISYLALTGLEVGLLMNSHVPVLTQGILRRVRQTL